LLADSKNLLDFGLDKLRKFSLPYNGCTTVPAYVVSCYEVNTILKKSYGVELNSLVTIFHREQNGCSVTNLHSSSAGTIAAASTAVLISSRSFTQKQIEFNVDQPFFYGVYHAQTQLFTFLGNIVDPTIN